MQDVNKILSVALIFQIIINTHPIPPAFCRRYSGIMTADAAVFIRNSLLSDRQVGINREMIRNKSAVNALSERAVCLNFNIL